MTQEKQKRGHMNDLERIIKETYEIRRGFMSNIPTLIVSDIAQAIQSYIDAGYVKREEIKVDEEELEIICNRELQHPDTFDDLNIDPLDMKKRSSLLATSKIIAKDISQNIQSLIVRKT